MADLFNELNHMLKSGWKQIDEWQGIKPGSEFFCVTGGFSSGWPVAGTNQFYAPSIHKFICGAILHKEPSHVKFVNGQATPIGNDRIWILRVTQDGTLHGGMSYNEMMFGSLTEAKAAVDKKISQRIVSLRDQAKANLDEAAVLEANSPTIEIQDFTVDLQDNIL